VFAAEWTEWHMKARTVFWRTASGDLW
jgi:hypothetical protein